jgi:hypothetical protein
MRAGMRAGLGWRARLSSRLGRPAMLARGAEPPGTPAIGGGGRLSDCWLEPDSAVFAVGSAGMLARGAERPGTPAIGGGGRLSDFCAEAAWPGPAVLGRGAESPGTRAIGGNGRLSGFGVEAGSAGFSGWLYAVASSAVAGGSSGSAHMGNAPERQ